MRTQRTRLNVEHLEARELLSVAYTPAQIRHAYGVDQLGIDGTGQTIAIVDAYDDPTIASDLHAFDQTFGIPDPPNFAKVNEFGGKILPRPDAGWSGEISLDVEWAHAIAPGANILLVEATTNNNNDLAQAVDFARKQPGVVTVSMSFGGGESSSETLGDSLFTTPSGHIGGFGLPGGITFVASTGDQGAPGGYPAYSPNVLAVGGTSLYTDSQGNYLFETGWSNGGGGISQVEPEPAYQYSVQNTGARTIPDVAYNADPNTGVYILSSFGSGGWVVEGGTSAGAPQWAALMALADEGRAILTGAGSLDGATQTLPAIYNPQMSGDFNDVTFGYNGYFAGPGYDLVTGLGSPYAPAVVYDLAVSGFDSPPPGAAPQSPTFTAFPNDAGALLAAKPVASIQEIKPVIDAVFASPDSTVVTAAKVDLVPLTPVSTNQVTPNHVSDMVPLHLGQSMSRSGDPVLDLGMLDVTL